LTHFVELDEEVDVAQVLVDVTSSCPNRTRPTGTQYFPHRSNKLLTIAFEHVVAS
jgi:hypothetical protein